MTTLRNLLHSFIPSSVISIWVWVPCVPRPGSTKPAPHLFLLVAGTGQHRLFPASWYALPHPLQNRVPRGADRQWRSAANRSQLPLRSVLGAPHWGAAPEAAAETSPSAPAKNRRKHWVFAGFLFACVAWFWGSFWFGLRVFSSGFTRSQPFPSPPAPKTHPVSPFSDDFGCVSLFLFSFDLQNFCSGFCAHCCIAFTD